jgi:hypothetical protein
MADHGDDRSISAFDFPDIVKYVEAIQEHERIAVPVLKPGREISVDYVPFPIAMLPRRHLWSTLGEADADRAGHP